MLAGGAAGGIESLITYPTEYIKTRQQLSNSGAASRSPLSILMSTLRSGGIGPIYTGAGIFCLSNASKSAVRFATFDVVRGQLPSDTTTGRPTPLSNMVAGACAGTAESVTVLTPGENIKTKLIDGRANQAGGGTVGTGQLISRIIAADGIRGLYRGVVPVAMKQSANSIVRFTSYQYLLDQTKAVLEKRGRKSGAIATAVAGGAAGVVTVYATMPFDNIKTKLQSLDSRTAYRGSLHCLQEIVRTDGVKGLWKGTTPRLIRLSVAGVLAFSIYEQVVTLTRKPQVETSVNMVPATM